MFAENIIRVVGESWTKKLDMNAIVRIFTKNVVQSKVQKNSNVYVN